MASLGTCGVLHCAGLSNRHRGASRTMVYRALLGERAEFRVFRLRSRPPACHRRGRSRPNHFRATAPMVRRWNAAGAPSASLNTPAGVTCGRGHGGRRPHLTILLERAATSGAGEGVASARRAPRPTLVCQRSVPISPCDLGLTRTPAERGLAGLRPLTPDGGSPRPGAASKAGAYRNRQQRLGQRLEPELRLDTEADPAPNAAPDADPDSAAVPAADRCPGRCSG